MTTAEQRKHLLELKYKYDELALGMSREELEQEAVEDTMSLFVNRFGMKPNKAMKTAQTEDELLVAIADNIEAQAQKAVAAATGEKPKRAGRKAKDAEPLQLSRRTLIEQLLMVKTMEEMQRVYSNLMDELYKGKEKDETSIAQKAERLKQLAVAGARRDLAEMMILQIGWIEEAAQEAPEEEDDFEKDPEDDFDDTDFTDDDFVDESEHPEEAKEEAKEDTPVFSSETKEDGHTYVTLDLKAAQDKAVQLRDTVFNKVGDTVSRIKNSSEYETVTGKINETVDKVRSNEDVQAVEEAAHTAAGAAKQAGSAAADLAKDAARYVADKVHTTVAEAAAEAKEAAEALAKEEAAKEAESAPATDAPKAEETSGDAKTEETTPESDAPAAE